MGLSHSIRWYQRRQSRHPDLAAWPEFTSFTATDVLAAGESMVGVAAATGTPSVRIGRRSVLADASLGREVWLDADLDACRPIEGTVRPIGRAGPPVRELTVRPTPRVGETRAWLPHDIRAGDLVAFACAEPVSLQDLRRRAHHPERLDDETVDVTHRRPGTARN